MIVEVRFTDILDEEHNIDVVFDETTADAVELLATFKEQSKEYKKVCKSLLPAYKSAVLKDLIVKMAVCKEYCQDTLKAYCTKSNDMDNYNRYYSDIIEEIYENDDDDGMETREAFAGKFVNDHENDFYNIISIRKTVDFKVFAKSLYNDHFYDIDMKLALDKRECNVINQYLEDGHWYKNTPEALKRKFEEIEQRLGGELVEQYEPRDIMNTMEEFKAYIKIAAQYGEFHEIAGVLLADVTVAILNFFEEQTKENRKTMFHAILNMINILPAVKIVKILPLKEFD